MNNVKLNQMNIYDMYDYIDVLIKNNQFEKQETNIKSPWGHSNTNIILWRDRLNYSFYEVHPATGSLIREISNEQYNEMKNYTEINYKWPFEYKIWLS